MGRTFTTAAYLSILTIASRVDAEKPKKDPFDRPLLVNVSSVGEHSTLAMECVELSKTQPRTIQCSGAYTYIAAPDATETARALKAVDDLRKQPYAAIAMKDICSKMRRSLSGASKTAAPLTAPERLEAERIAAACGASDKNQVWDALKWVTTEIDAKTCTVRTAFTGTYDYIQRDANTWEATATGACPGTTIMTLWRMPGDTEWNYKQVRSGVPNGSPACPVPKTTVEELRWDAVRRRDLQCVYIKI